MAGLGLTNALGMYQQGLGWHQQQQDRQRQQQQIAKQEARQAQLEAANKAAAGFIEQARAKAPNPDQWQPDDDTMFQAGALRSRELARAGLFDELAQNEVALEKQRMRARGSALQNWRLKRDPKQLIAQAYSTIPDGGTVQDVQPLDGGKRVKVKFSTGTEQEIDPEELAGALEKSLVEPGKYAELSIKRNMEEALIKARGEAQRSVIEARYGHMADLEETKQSGRLDVVDAQNKSRESIASGRNATQERIADTRGRYSLEGAKLRLGGDGAGGNGVKPRSSWVDGAGNRIQELTDGSFVNVGKDKSFQGMVRAEKKALAETAEGMRLKPDELEAAAIARITARAGKPVTARRAVQPQTSGLGAASQPGPGLSAARDADAGVLMIRSEMGGDIGRAKSELAQMRQGIASAPAGDARAMLESQAKRLEAGIQAIESGGKATQLPGLNNFKAGVPAGPAPSLDSLYKR